MKYQQLSSEERYYIEVKLKRGKSFSQIGNCLDRSPSTISREVKRNTGMRGYRYKQARRLTIARHHEKNKAIKLNDIIKGLIIEYLNQDYSPEQIAGKLKKDGVVKVHHETIYQFVLSDKKSGGSLYTKLRHQGKDLS